MDVEQRDEEISRLFTFLFCLLDRSWNPDHADEHNGNDLDVLNF